MKIRSTIEVECPPTIIRAYSVTRILNPMCPPRILMQYFLPSDQRYSMTPSPIPSTEHNKTKSTLPSDKPPDRLLLRQARNGIRVGEYLAVLVVTLSAYLVAPSIILLTMLITWGALFGGYLLLRRLLVARDHWLMKEKGVVYHGLVGVIGVATTYLLFRLGGYGVAETDPVNLWFLALVPLALVSRYGNTAQWGCLLSLCLGLLLGLRGGILYFTVLSNFWAAQSASVISTTIPLPESAYITIFVQAVILSLASSGIHYALRYRRMKDAQFQITFQVSHQLASEINPQRSYEQSARIIRQLETFPYEFFPIVHIMRWDSDVQRLRVVGGAGMPGSLWSGVEVGAGEGITGRVYYSGDPINAVDVKQLSPKEYTCPPGYEKVRSELAVPIIYQGNILGVLDVQSHRVGEFDNSDERLLTILASGLGISFGNAMSIDHRITSAYQLASKTLGAGENHRRLKTWFDEIAQAACEHLKVDRLILFRLSPGTASPLKGPLIGPKLAKPFPGEGYWPIPDGSVFWRLLQRWEPAFNVQLALSPNTRQLHPDAWACHFMETASLSTLAFVPVGLNQPLAALFMGYERPRNFGDIDKLALITFGAALEISYKRVIPTPREPWHWGSAVHEAMSGGVHEILSQLQRIRADLGDTHHLQSLLIDVQEGIKKIRENVELATMGHSFTPDERLKTLLERIAGQLNSWRSVNISFEITGTEEIEGEDQVLVAILYKIAAEAMANAVAHGGDNMNLVQVEFRKDDHSIRVTVTDNGQGLQPGHSTTRPHGIYYWKHLIRREFQAHLRLENRPDGGACITLSVPCCPWPGRTEDVIHD